jgi:hypothetical protein
MSKEGDVEVSKTEFTKPARVTPGGASAVAGNNPELLQSLLS